MNCGIEGEYSFKFSNYARDLLIIIYSSNILTNPLNIRIKKYKFDNFLVTQQKNIKCKYQLTDFRLE